MGLFSSLFGGGGKKPEEPQAEAAEESVEELAAGLDSPDGGVRVDSARILLDRWRSGDVAAAEKLAPRLPELLDDDEPMVRVTALSGVRMLRKPENLEKNASGVVALLADPVQQVRIAAIWSAVRLPGDAAREQVRKALESTEEAMRFAAACALSDVKDPASLPELTAALRDDHRRQEALSAIMSLGLAAALPELRTLFEDETLGEFDKTLAAAALARFGDEPGAAYLVERIEQGGDDRPIAAEWAGRLDVRQAIDALNDLAEDDSDPAQGAAIRALGRLHALGAEARLLKIAGDPQARDDLRMDAAEGLAELGTPPVLELLKKLAEAAGPEELAQLCRELLVEVAQPDAD
ncbi:MAG TPA: HEAT repeat domain-containing protein [Myxococcales bacterium]|nr:HEAT repeat domain-containing protein [Myxococcales bacterium]